MKKTILSMTVFLMMTAGMSLVPYICQGTEEDSLKTEKSVCSTNHGHKHKKHSKSSWDDVISSIMYVESRGNKRASNHSCKGIMQISPSAVRDANEYLRKTGKKKRFTNHDRFSPERSMEIFKIEQERYNKEHNIEKAIRIWNGGPHYKKRGTSGYYHKVMKVYHNKKILGKIKRK